ncbi:protein translocase subunit SecD [Tessaracoccus sp. OH4464_COT-324]|nr:protein translocase subunit SecD [Tessaracoccus sp. OH4464_COT-324]
MSLCVFIALLFAIMAGTRTWAPKLGLDLQGGMTITLTATNATVTPESMELAVAIIQQRVDGMGVGEASVTTMGDRNIVVSAPNVTRDDLVELVGATAQLEFRPVLSVAPAVPSDEKKEELDPLPRPEGGQGTLLAVSDVLAYQPTADAQQKFNDFVCGDPYERALDQAQIVCDVSGTQKLLLGPVAVQGKSVTNARADIPSGTLSWAVDLTFNSEGASRFAETTTRLVSNPEPTNMFAIVLDGKVRSFPRVQSAITNGTAQITGSFTPEEANQLANVLRFGSLPLDFEPSQVESVSPTLGGEQLRVGLIAGLLGLLVVAIYALAYYRGLGLVVIGSLLVAAGTTYASMVLLGSAVGFTLSLAAIAGAIVGIAVTADSFIIYFERIRDEVREGSSLRRAMETGWKKARGTILIADCVSLLSAAVLYILAVGGVQGFAFALGLTTLIDLAVVFFFTKPLVSVLGRTKFFGEGHPLSGLSADHMGVSRQRLLGRRVQQKEA